MAWLYVSVSSSSGGALVLPACSDDCGDGEYRDAEICFQEHVLKFQSGAAGALALRAADFDGDGAHDLLVVGADAGVLTTDLRLGDGAGGLGEPRDVGVAGCSAYPIAADLDADGAADLVFPTCSDGVYLYRADGRGGFLPRQEVAVGLKIRTTAVTDVDGDGRRDLLVLGDMSGRPAMSLVRAAPAGGFAAPVVQPLVVRGAIHPLTRSLLAESAAPFIRSPARCPSATVARYASPSTHRPLPSAHRHGRRLRVISPLDRVAGTLARP